MAELIVRFQYVQFRELLVVQWYDSTIAQLRVQV